MSKRINNISLSVAFGTIALLPACDWLKKQETEIKEGVEAVEKKAAELVETDAKGAEKATPEKEQPAGAVLMTIKGEPVITIGSLEQYKNDIIEAQPEAARDQYRNLMEMVPGALRNIFDSQVSEELISRWVKEKSIDQTPAYKKELQDIRKRIENFSIRSLNIKAFQEAFPPAITDAEVRKYYDENKNKIEELMLSAGGVSAKAVFFDKEDDAKAFLKKASDPKSNLDTLAKDQKLTVKDLGLVGENSYEVDAPIRTKLMEIKTFPAVELIKVSDGSFAVVKATAKEEPKYVPFDQVKVGLEQWLKQQKSGEVMLKELDKLKKEYNVQINEDFFKAQQPAAKPGLPAGAQEAPAAGKEAVPARPARTA